MSAPADEHRAYAPRSLGFASLTVSDSRTPESDDSGRMIERQVAESTHEFLFRKIRPDDCDAVRAAIEEWLKEPAVDVIVVSGGTGLAPRDITIEAVSPLFERQIPGFGELFRSYSCQEVGPAAMLSRATAGITGGKAIFLLPGSPKAVELAMEKLILPEAAHLLGQVRRGGG